MPLYNPLSHIVYTASSHQVKHVWVAGKCVLKNRTLTTFDVDNLKHRIKKWQEKLQP